jgi:DNA repair protein RadD
MTYTLTIDSKKITITPPLSEVLDAALVSEFSYISKAAEQAKFEATRRGYGWRYKDISTKLYKKNSNVFSVGFLKKIVDYFDRFDIQYVFQDNRIFPKLNKVKLPDFLWDHQKIAIETAISCKRGMLSIPTGAGKSMIIAFLLKYFKGTCLVTVPSQELLDQTIKAIEEFFPNEKIGKVGSGFYEPERITVGIINSVSNSTHDASWKKWLSNLDCVLFDECHLSASEMYRGVGKCLDKTIYIIGLSGTPYREDGTDLELEAIAGPKIYTVSEMDLIHKGVLTKPTITFIKDLFPKKGSVQKKPWLSVYKEMIVENERRNKIALYILQEHMLKQKGSGLILVSQINHGLNLQKMYEELFDQQICFIHGTSDKQERARVIKGLSDLSIKGAIASTILDTGVNIRPLDLLIFAGGEKASSTLRQRIGRSTRLYPSKKESLIYDFEDDYRHYLKEHSFIRKKVCSSVFTNCVFNAEVNAEGKLITIS